MIQLDIQRSPASGAPQKFARLLAVLAFECQTQEMVSTDESKKHIFSSEKMGKYALNIILVGPRRIKISF